MIRNVTVGRLRPDIAPSVMDDALAALVKLDIDGMTNIYAGRDLDLKDGTWDFVVTADFVDEAAYRRYDADEEHNRLRREAFIPSSEEIARAQFSLPD